MQSAWQTIKPFLQPYRWRIALVFASVLGTTLAGLASPWLVRNLVRVLRTADGDANAARNGVIITALLLLLTYGVRSVCQFINFHHSHVVAWNVLHDLRTTLYDKLQFFSPAYYAERQTGEIVSRVVRDTNYLEPLIADAVYDFLVSILLAFGVLWILIALDPVLAGLAFLPLPFVIAVILKLRRPAVKIFKAEAHNVGEISALLQDNISGIRDIQIYTRESHELARVTTLSDQLRGYQIRARQYMAGMYPLIEGGAGLSTVVAIGIGGVRVLNGHVDIEDLVAFVLYLAGIYQPLWKMAAVGEWVERGVASLGRIREVLETEPTVADAADGVDLGRANGRLALENVGFAYQNEAVLHDVSLAVATGETLALVGPTGAGKSTLANLLTRFYDPQFGRITLDGHDLRDIQLGSLRRNISVVLQDVFLFYASVAENIRFARPDATDADVIAAAKVADAHDFIAALPQGYDTLVGERGIKLSGGQKQRISIARAVLKDAPILILDEATSSVDTETEAQIQAALNKLMQGRTSVVIAHRLSTIRDADQIAVLNDGQIVELGQHDEITKQDGLYARLLARQAM